MNTPKNATDNAVLLRLTHITAKCGIPITFHDLLDIPPHTKEYNDIWTKLTLIFQALTPFRSDFFGGKHLRF